MGPPTQHRRVRRVLPSGFQTIRDATTFLLGLGIICNEVFVQDSVEAAAMTVGIALLGLPVVFGADEKKKT